MEIKDQIAKKLVEMDGKGIEEILYKMNDKIFADNRELNVELHMLTLLKMISSHEDVDSVFMYATDVVTPEIRSFVELY